MTPLTALSQPFAVFALLIEWFKQNPTYGALLTTLITAALSTVAWLLVKFGQLVRAVFRYGLLRYSRRIKLVRISKDKRREIVDFFSLYEKAFTLQERFSTIEILEWLRGKAKLANLDYCLLVVLNKKLPVAIGIYMRCKRRRIIFVPYLALAEESAGFTQGREAMAKLFRAAQPWYHRPYVITFEVENPHQSGISPNERNRRNARIRRLQQYCGALGLRMVFPDLKYRQPPFRSDAGLPTYKDMVLGMIVTSRMGRSVLKERMTIIMQYIFHEIYITCVPEDDDNRQIYLSDIEQSYRDTVASMKSEVLLRQLSGSPPSTIAHQTTKTHLSKSSRRR